MKAARGRRSGRLQRRRKELGLEPAEVAKRAGCSAEYVRLLERRPAEANPTLEVARALARALDTTADELFPAAAGAR